MTNNSHEISRLNKLISTTIDSADGYEEAEKHSESARFTGMFRERAAERRTVLVTLRKEVTRLGGEPEDDGTMLAGAHRMFLNLKSAVTGQDEKAIIDEVEQGEDHIKAEFETAMEDEELSPAVRNVVRECYTSIKRGHDQMRDIKHAMEGNH